VNWAQVTNRQVILFTGLGAWSALIWLVLKHSVNVPHWDEWAYVAPMFHRYFSDGFSAELIFTQSGEHNIAIPKLLIFLIGILTSSNYSAFHLTNVLILGLSFWLIAKSSVDVNQVATKESVLVILLLALLMFNLGIPGVYLWGLSAYLFVTQFLIILILQTVTSATRPKSRLFLPLLILLATHSSITGYLMIPISLILLFAAYKIRGKGIDYLEMLSVAGAGLISIASYYLYKSHSGYPNGVTLHPTDLWKVLDYAAVYLGTSFASGDLNLARNMGILFSILSISPIYRFTRNWSPTSPFSMRQILFVSLIAISIGSALLTAIGRSGQFPISQATDDRYAIYSNLGWIGLTGYWLANLRHRRSVTQLVISLTVSTLTLLYIKTVQLHFPKFETLLVTRTAAKNALVHMENLDELKHIGPEGSEYILKNYRPLLSTHSLGPFRDVRE